MVSFTMRRQLLLAYGIAEWASALEHLRSMPLPMASTPHVEDDLRHMISQWRDEFREWGALEGSVIAEARAYLTEHQTELNQLLTEEVKQNG